jgi:hypothetical protein
MFRNGLACVLLAFWGCGSAAGSNPAFAGSWTTFIVNGSQNLGGFVVDGAGQFVISAAGAQVSGAIGPDASIDGAAQGSFGGVCTLQGHCTSTSVCSGTTVGGGCPADENGRPWATFAFCRGPGC